MAARLGLPALLGPSGRQRNLALALIISQSKEGTGTVLLTATGPYHARRSRQGW